MVFLPNWFDARRIPIENGSGDEEIPKAGKNRRSSGKSRIIGGLAMKTKRSVLISITLVFDLLILASCATVLYSGNGNTSGTIPLDRKAYIVGGNGIAQSNKGLLKRPGFIFSGWNTKPDGSGDAIAEGQSFSIGKSGIKLYARWNASFKTSAATVVAHHNWRAIATSLDGEHLVAAASKGDIYTSKDGGSTWIDQVTAGARDWYSVAVSLNGMSIYALEHETINFYGPAKDDLYFSSDGGNTWDHHTFSGVQHFAMSPEGDRLIIVDALGNTNSSQDGGHIWSQLSLPTILAIGGVLLSTYIGDHMLAIDSEGCFYSSVDGTTWAQVNSPNSSGDWWRTIAVNSDGNHIFAQDHDNNVFTSGDGGATWRKGTDTALQLSIVFDISRDGKHLVASDGRNLIVSHNSGESWTALVALGQNNLISSVISDNGQRIIAATAGGSIDISADGGTTWGESRIAGSNDWSSVASSADGSSLVAADRSDQIFTSTDGGASWIGSKPLSGCVWFSVASSYDGLHLLAGGECHDTNLATGAIAISSDGGKTWVCNKPKDMYSYITSVAMSRDGRSMAVLENKMRVSDDSGATWITAKGIPERNNWRQVVSDDSGKHLTAISYDSKIYSSSDDGSTWVTQESTREQNWSAIACSADGKRLVAGTFNGYLSTSGDGGLTWTERTDAGKRRWTALASSADGLYLAAAAEDDQIYFSTDAGRTWIAQKEAGARKWSALALKSDGNRLIAGVSKGDIYILQ